MSLFISIFQSTAVATAADEVARVAARLVLQHHGDHYILRYPLRSSFKIHGAARQHFGSVQGAPLKFRYWKDTRFALPRSI